MPVSTTATTTSELPVVTFQASAASTSASRFTLVLPSIAWPVLCMPHWLPNTGSSGRQRPLGRSTGQAAGAGAAAASPSTTSARRVRAKRVMHPANGLASDVLPPFGRKVPERWVNGSAVEPAGGDRGARYGEAPDARAAAALRGQDPTGRGRAAGAGGAGLRRRAAG